MCKIKLTFFKKLGGLIRWSTHQFTSKWSRLYFQPTSCSILLKAGWKYTDRLTHFTMLVKREKEEEKIEEKCDKNGQKESILT